MKEPHRIIALITLVFAFNLITPSAGALADENRPETYLPQSTYFSSIKESPIPYTALGVEWRQLTPPGTSAYIYIRFQEQEGWGKWKEIEDDSYEEFQSGDMKSALLNTQRSAKFQYKVYLESSVPHVTPVLDQISLTYINAKSGDMGVVNEDKPIVKDVVSAALPEETVVKKELTAAISFPQDGSTFIPSVSSSFIAKSFKPGSIRVISRSEWGADESLRVYTKERPDPQLVKLDPDFGDKFASELKIIKKVDKNQAGEDLTWPMEYPQKVTKIIIHHTATDNDLEDPKQAIRNIYYWHAITRGWGDIGYNFIIDRQGNIYEGRAGGDGVVGSHAGKANVGSIGISIIGNYQENDIPDAVIQSLISLINIKATLHHINPVGESTFRGEILPNIIGHRDVMNTTCPGDNLYDLLPAIRLLAKDGLKSNVVDKRRGKVQSGYDFLPSTVIPMVTFEPGGKQRIKISLKNTGAVKWGKDTVVVLNSGESTQSYLESDGMIRSSAAGKEIKSGESANFELNLKAGFRGGISHLELFPLVDGKTKIEKYLNVPFQVKSPIYEYEFISAKIDKNILKRNETTQAKISLRNNGNVTWTREGDNRIMIGTENPRDHISSILEKQSARLAAMDQREVKPGATATFTVKIKAPSSLGSYSDDYAPVIEGVTWLPAKNKSLGIFVYDVYWAATLPGKAMSFVLQPGESKKLSFDIRNVGGGIWSKDSRDNLNFEITRDNGFTIKTPVLSRTTVLPGQTVTVEVPVVAPSVEGNYSFKITPKAGTKKLVEESMLVVLKVPKKESGSVTSDTSKNVPANKGNASSSIKVDIGYNGNPAIISASGSFNLYEGSKMLGSFVSDEKVTVSFDKDRFGIKGNKSSYTTSVPPRFKPVGDSILRIDDYNHRPEWNKSYNDNEYRGDLVINQYQNALHVVNELPIEDYLKGLAEISAKDPVEKIKAIIVAARTYAVFYTTVAEKFPGAPFDLTDDPQRSQIYLGYGFEKRNPTGVKAVKATENMVVTYNGKIVKTPYFSSDDGRTRSAEETWQWKDTPYLQSVDDPGCKGKTMNGHGVGMSGCGSLYLAGKGKSYIEILKYFYKGVEVTKRK